MASPHTAILWVTVAWTRRRELTFPGQGVLSAALLCRRKRGGISYLRVSGCQVSVMMPLPFHLPTRTGSLSGALLLWPRPHLLSLLRICSASTKVHKKKKVSLQKWVDWIDDCFYHQVPTTTTTLWAILLWRIGGFYWDSNEWVVIPISWNGLKKLMLEIMLSTLFFQSLKHFIGSI